MVELARQFGDKSSQFLSIFWNNGSARKNLVFERVNESTAELDAEMQVWARGATGRSHVADDLSSSDLHPRPDLRCEAGQVSVIGLQIVPVVDDDEIAVGPFSRRESDLTGFAGPDGCSTGCREIDAAVKLAATQNGVVASSKLGADSGVVKGHTEQCFGDGYTLLIVVRLLAVLFEKEEALPAGFDTVVFDCPERTVADERVLEAFLLGDDAKAVSGSLGLEKINLVGENINDFAGKGGMGPQLADSFVERGRYCTSVSNDFFDSGNVFSRADEVVANLFHFVDFR